MFSLRARVVLKQPQSRRSARFGDARRARSVWTAAGSPPLWERMADNENNFMNEKPKSIWKKSWTGWRGLLMGWLILTITLTTIPLIWLMVEGVPVATRSGDEWLLFGVMWIAVTIIFLLVTFIRWLWC